MPEESKDTRTLLENAIRKRDELNTFIKVLQEMLGISGEASAQPEAAKANAKPAEGSSGSLVDPLAVVYPGMFFGKTQPQAVKLLLEQVRRPTPMRIVLEALEKGGLKVGGKKPAVNLWGVLDRNSDTFILVPKAGWALTEWYEASVLAKMRKKGADIEEAKEAENGEDEPEEKSEAKKP